MTQFQRPPASWALVILVLTISYAFPLLWGGSSLTQLRVLCAVVPTLVMLHLFIQSDLFPEPPHLLVVTFVLGILVTVPAVLVAIILGRALGGFDAWGPVASPVLRAFAGAALPEETAKFLVLTFYCARRSAFDEPMDGLVYGVTASLGFAALENVLYIFKEPAYPGWVEVAALRAFTAVPAHAVDGAVMGFFIGLRRAIPVRRAQLTQAAWAVPVVLHGLYDLGAFIGVPSLWSAVFLFELSVAKRMHDKLQAIQGRREHPEAVVQWAWAGARRKLGLKPRELPQPAGAMRRSLRDAEAERAAADVVSAPTCSRCQYAVAVCICSPDR